MCVCNKEEDFAEEEEKRRLGEVPLFGVESSSSSRKMESLQSHHFIFLFNLGQYWKGPNVDSSHSMMSHVETLNPLS